MSALMSIFMSLPKDVKQRIWDKAMKDGKGVVVTMKRYPELYRE